MPLKYYVLKGTEYFLKNLLYVVVKFSARCLYLQREISKISLRFYFLCFKCKVTR